MLARLQRLVGAPPEGEAAAPDHDRLVRLADSRARAAKTYLVDQAGIEPGRLFTCRSKVEDSAPPRVDLLL
ncbi:hypothetical protein [Magnetospirillum sp. UT-4]|uniref:hypothetical protein n=1 Tax=Magnetospirillum sp. UT-4 TaxID=2681467 RepID=UPI00137DEE93|nr:hypothetical protein [Magnetospirillum sp. UT-4]CAA7620407.1 hypothetical protein MTBUT4_350051 [Magnetospirillum sp. UT-4]